MLGQILSKSRYIIVVGVLGTFALASLLLLIGAFKVFKVFKGLFKEGFPAAGDKLYLLDFIEIVDLFLLSTVFYVTALGLYELFVDNEMTLPSWLEIKNIDDLKLKLISVVIVTLGVLFLGRVITWDGETDLLGYGVGIGAVVAALSFFVRQKK